MKSIIFTLCIVSLNVFAKSESTTFHLSPTFKIDIPFEVVTKADFPSLNTNYLRITTNENSASDVYFIHKPPPTLANKFSVERYWKASRQETKSADKNEKNFGCAKLNSKSYQCTRTVGQNGKFVYESLFWNAKADLVLIRVTTLSSFEQSKKVLDSFKIHQNFRSPAGSKK